MFEFFNAKYRHIVRRHNIAYDEKKLTKPPRLPITSVVIPSVGEDYIAEAMLSATFAQRYAQDVQEIVIVTDQPAQKFPLLPEKARVVTLATETRDGVYRYKQIYLSRLIKLQAPLQARTEGILMIDSDLNLLQMPDIQLADDDIYASFRQGKMIAKLSGITPERIPAYYRDAIRPKLVDHVNGAFLAATRKTWQRMCPVWMALFIDTWAQMDDDQPPTDQLPLAAMLDTLDIRTVNLGEWMNWPVSKKIGGTPSIIPAQVVGAHGGFPLAEWQKYLQSPETELLFKSQDYTRKVRYLTDNDKQI
ncbi:hypothetical protein [Acerihabitans arboris]|uniref:Glycosyltransferase n=1 Tax=Acerihabitans arboris TaxID=2691583 RepID=A0A845SPD0_9GAMM|nr:hypothetical protein [Acerihabitans arboris]NDL64794.1 hypothetical protein [Acerihabitans arboris]